MPKDFYKPTMAEVFTEWRRRYKADPDGFELPENDDEHGEWSAQYYKKLELEMSKDNTFVYKPDIVKLRNELKNE